MNEIDLLKENEDLHRRFMAGMRRRMQKWRPYRKEQKLAAYVRNKNRLCFRIKYRIKISFF